MESSKSNTPKAVNKRAVAEARTTLENVFRKIVTGPESVSPEVKVTLFNSFRDAMNGYEEKREAYFKMCEASYESLCALLPEDIRPNAPHDKLRSYFPDCYTVTRCTHLG